MGDKDEVFDGNQYGFTKGTSRLTNLVAFYGRVIVPDNKGRTIDAIYQDLYKAFNTISYSILLIKLEKMHLMGGPLTG